MKYILNLNINVNDINKLEDIIIKKLRISKKILINYKIYKQSIDARDKTFVKYVMQILIEVSKEIKSNLLLKYNEYQGIEYFKTSFNYRPIIVGFGPSGMFAALYLARIGAKPIILERGLDVDSRNNAIKEFFENKILDENNNVVFGEGGAGTFSDGKLQSNIKNEYNRFILEELVKHGAKEDILISNYPHVGTDILSIVCKNIRNEIISLGGEVIFNALFFDFKQYEDYSEIFYKKDGQVYSLASNNIILGLGHSAYDTIKILKEKNMNIEPKPFSMGVRIEHLQEKINVSQYKEFASKLEAAPYKLACHLKDRSVYTFCMCPGGYVVASANSKNSIVTNGMSYSKRDGKNANSALLVEVKVDDYYINDCLDGFRFQQKYEKLAFNEANDYRAPINLVGEFLTDTVASATRSVTPTYPHGYVFSDMKQCLPNFVLKSLKEAIPLLDKKLSGFADKDAVITAVESRSSSPIRMVRTDFKSNFKHIYVVGEGAGYAGGIMTSAIDGLKCAIYLSRR